MHEYNWNINDINKIQDENLKKILLSEYHGTETNEDFTIIKELNVKEFKKNYKAQKRILISYNKEIAKICDLLPYTLTEGLLPEYIFPHQNFTEEIVLDIINSFIKTLNDPTLMNLFNKLINKDNHLLKLEKYSQENLLTQYIRGRVISKDNNIFVSYFLKDDITDICSLMHEISHYFALNIKENYHFKTFLSEFEAKYMEYLIIFYILEKLNDELLGKTLISTQISYAVSDIYISYYQTLVAKKFSNNYHEETYLKILNKKLHTDIKNPPPKDLIFNNKINELKGRIISNMLALCILDKNDFDYEKCAQIYKSILTNPESNLNKLLAYYNVTTQEYLDNFNEYYQMNAALSKQLQK